ncbi:23S rRNA (adenine(2503)-C(2))-methyltransferase RlmN [Candidatus Margulisiibacteriota bacterium]
MKKKSLLNIAEEDLQEELKKLKLPKFVAGQILSWIYEKHVLDFSEMTNISKSNRALLEDKFRIREFQGFETVGSDDGLAKKYVFELFDGLKIESVLLTEKGYNTLCISSQVGCPAKCRFCATGYMGFKRNLSALEIISQILFILKTGEPVSHVVFMGMGEPLLNLDNVLKSIALINSDKGLNISKRKVTVSTCGIIKGIQHLIDEKIALNLAFSVGSPDPMKRKIIMPIEAKNSIIEIARLLKQYLKEHNRKLTMEYTLIKGKNDSEEEIRELGNLAKYLNAKVNLINLNPSDLIPFEPVAVEVINKVKKKLSEKKVNVTIRYSKGAEITAACGQLAS